MAVEVIMPKAGMDMQEGKIIQWFKNVGDKVSEGDALLEIETDKVNMEVEAPADGVLLAKYYEDGEVVPVVTVIAFVGAEGEKVEQPAGSAAPTAAPAAAPVPVAAEVAAPVAKAAPVITTGYVPATPLAKAMAAENVISLNAVAPTGEMGEVKARDVVKYLEELSAEGKISVTPLAKRIALDLGVDLASIVGTGYNNKITKADVYGAAKAAEAPVVEEIVVASVGVKRVKLSGMRKVVAQRMSQSRTEIPEVTQNSKADVTDLMAMRAQINEGREVKFSVNDFVLKAVAKALGADKNPLANIQGDEIVYEESVNLGMAVAIDAGLVVPVLVDADKKSMGELAAYAKDMAKKARAGKLTMDEMSGSTFTVTNVGMYGVESFTPIINQPNSCILGVCAITDEYCLYKGEAMFRKKLGLSFAHDHRSLDGAPAAEFMQALRWLLEHPYELLL